MRNTLLGANAYPTSAGWGNVAASVGASPRNSGLRFGVGSSHRGSVSRQHSSNARSDAATGSRFGPASRQQSPDASTARGRIGSASRRRTDENESVGAASRQVSSDSRRGVICTTFREPSEDAWRGGLRASSLSASQPLPSKSWAGGAGTSSLGSDDGDALTSVSAARPIGGTSDVRPSVLGLRDRLVREARNERQRCLDIAEAAERRRAELCGIGHVATQTEEVFLVEGPGASPDGMPTSFDFSTWGESDEAAQAEALRTIKLLGARDSFSKESASNVTQLEEMLRAEEAAVVELDAQLVNERTRKEAAQQQVLCLEYELDGKEAALQVAERALEGRDTDLQHAQLQLLQLQEGLDRSMSDASAQAQGDSQLRALRAQVVEREQLLHQKDQHIAGMLDLLRQHRSLGLEEDSTMCGSDRSMAVSMSTLAGAGTRGV
mmetsp:Transcript_48018/g.133994  ORF Transcript_48018/g.133994 Transcript_48018/m.133994 type:complete len:437 (-) Transcript_48018:36-1346(-)